MLRPAAEGDLPSILAIYAPYVERDTASFEYTVPTPAEFAARFRETTVRFPWLVWEEDGEVIGYAYASAPFTRAAYRWCAEPSIYLRADVRGRGLGTALYDALEALLCAQGYQLLYALITGENTASLHFHERRGYEILARFPDCGFKFGRWLDLVWLQKRLCPVENPDRFPIAWNEFRQNAQKISNILGNLSIS